MMLTSTLWLTKLHLNRLNVADFFSKLKMNVECLINYIQDLQIFFAHSMIVIQKQD